MKSLLVLFAATWFAACSGTQKIPAAAPSSELVPHGKLWSSLFQQKSAEYDALCLQAYNIARMRLDEALKNPSAKPPAIITDIDETFLDNSPYAVRQALAGKDYDAASWQNWTSLGIADTLNGALAFFNYAASRKVEVFYITNRKEAEKTGTMANLRHFAFPFADDSHLLLRQEGSSKESRRQSVAQHFDIILLLGDNLADFSPLFDKGPTIAGRSAAVNQLASEFGKKFIVLPNANYGGWEEAIYGNNFNLSTNQKDSAIKTNLKGY